MTALSNGGKTWLTKLNHIRDGAEKNASRVFNNVGHIIDEHLLLECYRQLDGKKAVGIDGITKEIYGADLAAKIAELLVRIRRGTYKPQPSRIVEIPKPNGDKRPLAISCFEDKIVQMAVKMILEAIFEPKFLPCSYGFRPGKNAHQALTRLVKIMGDTKKGELIEIDIKKYFNSVPMAPLQNMLKSHISDTRFLGLIHKLLTAETLDDAGNIQKNMVGVPQGSIASPILANIYLHFAIDTWIEELKSFFRHGIELVRFADDLVFVFEDRLEAYRFFDVLPKRLAKFGLEMAIEKSSMVTCGRWRVRSLLDSGKPMPKFKFLGFEVMWTPNRRGFIRPRVKPRQDRMNEGLKAIKMYLAKSRTHSNHQVVLRKVLQVTRGWMQYFAVSDCSRYLWNFVHRVRIMIHRWFNRRGKTGCMNWEKLHKILSQLGFRHHIPLYSLFPSSQKMANAAQNSGA